MTTPLPPHEPTHLERLTAERQNVLVDLESITDPVKLRRVALRWWDAAQGVRALGEQDRRRAEREASHAVAAALDWTAAARHPSHSELRRRRGEQAA